MKILAAACFRGCLGAEPAYCNSRSLGVSCRSSVLLLAPLLAEADPAPRRVSRPSGSAGAQGTDGLCTHFRWMADHVPVFRVPGTHIHVLTSPDQFYQAMKVRVSPEPNVWVH